MSVHGGRADLAVTRAKSESDPISDIRPSRTSVHFSAKQGIRFSRGEVRFERRARGTETGSGAGGGCR